MSQWNGRSFIPFNPPPQCDVLITTDASGNWGCAATWGDHWWQWQWTSSTSNWNISAKELFPIILAAATRGSQWWHAQVNCNCDNQAAANVINKGSARDPLLAHLLRYLFFYAAHFQFQFTAQHIPGHSNLAADALSRNQLTTFSSLPQTNPVPDQINPVAASLASLPSLTWTCSHWVSLSELINQGIAPITARVYNSAQSRFIKFCNDYNLFPYPYLKIQYVYSFLIYLIRN